MSSSGGDRFKVHEKTIGVIYFCNSLAITLLCVMYIYYLMIMSSSDASSAPTALTTPIDTAGSTSLNK